MDRGGVGVYIEDSCWMHTLVSSIYFVTFLNLIFSLESLRNLLSSSHLILLYDNLMLLKNRL